MNLRLVEVEDWMALYLDERLVMEGHEITLEDFMRAYAEDLGINWGSAWVETSWLEQFRGFRFPTMLTEREFRLAESYEED